MSREQEQPSPIWLLGWAQVLWIRSLMEEGKSPEEALDYVMDVFTPRARQEIQRHRERILDFFRTPRIEGQSS